MEKKDVLRFTLRFDGTDMRQRNTAEILGKLGRKKARYVAEAVSFYENYRAGGGGYTPPPVPWGNVRKEGESEHIQKITDEGAAEKRSRETTGNLDQADIRAMKSGMDVFRRKKR